MPGAGSGNPAARAQWGLLSEQVHGQMGGSWLTDCSKLTTQEAGNEPLSVTQDSLSQPRSWTELDSTIPLSV